MNNTKKDITLHSDHITVNSMYLDNITYVSMQELASLVGMGYNQAWYIFYKKPNKGRLFSTTIHWMREDGKIIKKIVFPSFVAAMAAKNGGIEPLGDKATYKTFSVMKDSECEIISSSASSKDVAEILERGDFEELHIQKEGEGSWATTKPNTPVEILLDNMGNHYELLEDGSVCAHSSFTESKSLLQDCDWMKLRNRFFSRGGEMVEEKQPKK